MSHQFWWWILWTFWWQLWWLWQNGWISGKTKVSPPPATPAPGEASAPHQQYHPPLRHPPHLLLSPSPSSGRRRVMSVGRPSRWPTPLGTWQPQPGRLHSAIIASIQTICRLQSNRQASTNSQCQWLRKTIHDVHVTAYTHTKLSHPSETKHEPKVQMTRISRNIPWTSGSHQSSRLTITHSVSDQHHF